MSIKVAIDCRPLQSPYVAGVGVYTRELIAEWAIDDFLEPIALTVGRTEVREKMAEKNIHLPVSGKFFNLACVLGCRLPRLEAALADSDYVLLTHPTYWPVSDRKYLLTVHDLSFIERPYFYRGKYRLWHLGLNFKRLVSQASGIIAVSDATAQRLKALFPDVVNKPLRVIPNGVRGLAVAEADQERIRTELKLPAEYFLFVGTLEPRKNIISALEAFRRLHQEFPEISFVIVGKYGWGSRNFKALIKELPIIWLDYLPEGYKSTVYQSARGLVWPSWYEGFGFPPLEAAVCGLPVITSWATAMPEILGNSAYYVNPYNYQEIADVMRQILIHPPTRRINKDLERAYSWKQTADQTRNFIKELYENRY